MGPMNIFLDACAIIYFMEAKEPFYSTVHGTLSQIVEENPDASLAISRLSILECLVQPLRHRHTFTIEQYRTFFASQDLQIVELTSAVIEKALWLRVNYNLRTPDALQAACALELAPFGILFLTGDKAFTKVPELNAKIL
jgi:predicted nucleic acid-binding protein